MYVIREKAHVTFKLTFCSFNSFLLHVPNTQNEFSIDILVICNIANIYSYRTFHNYFLSVLLSVRRKVRVRCLNKPVLANNK
jgi:hypothetical protein